MVRSVIDNIVPSQNIQQIILVGAGLLALYAFSTTLNFIVVYMGHILGINIETDMRRELFAKVQKTIFLVLRQYENWGIDEPLVQ